MIERENPPFAPSLMESMRSMGYSLGSALADLVDNSIFARAQQIDLFFSPFDDAYIAIADNGDGMSPESLDAAMRHGSSNPLELRRDLDLGRFGLGLKTASLSQCRCMTVITLCEGTLSARRWDMNVINQRKKWIMLELDSEEISSLPHVNILQKYGHGTIVLWKDLDRLLAGEADIERAIGEKVDEAREHLALVFHRFIEGEQGLRRVMISINGTELKSFDPFLAEHSLTQKLQEDRFQIEGRSVSVKPFILPHPSRLSPQEATLAGGIEGLRSHQGFYVYRGKRLIVWGTWFRLARKDELSRLARVRVDIPNSLDHLWVLDIRKSIAHPPEAVRLQLRRTIERIREQSRQTHVNRGYKERHSAIEHAWIRVFSGGTVRYDVNRDHHAIKSMIEGLDADNKNKFEVVLRVIEASFPVESLYVDVASEQNVKRTEDAREELRIIATGLLQGISPQSALRIGLLANLHLIEPFSAHPEIAQQLAKELENVR